MNRNLFLKKFANGKFMRVIFIKRTTGEVRVMLCRTGVHHGTSGGELKYDPVKKGLVTVWDVQRRGYRMIPLDGIVHIKCGSERYDHGATG